MCSACRFSETDFYIGTSKIEWHMISVFIFSFLFAFHVATVYCRRDATAMRRANTVIFMIAANATETWRKILYTICDTEMRIGCVLSKRSNLSDVGKMVNWWWGRLCYVYECAWKTGEKFMHREKRKHWQKTHENDAMNAQKDCELTTITSRTITVTVETLNIITPAALHGNWCTRLFTKISAQIVEKLNRNSLWLFVKRNITETKL